MEFKFKKLTVDVRLEMLFEFELILDDDDDDIGDESFFTNNESLSFLNFFKKKIILFSPLSSI